MSFASVLKAPGARRLGRAVDRFGWRRAECFADETAQRRTWRSSVIQRARDLSALIGAELSGRPDVALVEREDLSRLGDERKLELACGYSDAVALGKLAWARTACSS